MLGGPLMHLKIGALWKRLRDTYITSFLRLSRGFKVVILEGMISRATSPEWFSIYMKDYLGATNEQIGLYGALTDFFQLIFHLPGGSIGQRVKDKRVLYLASILLSVAYYLVAFFAGNWEWLIVMGLLSSFGALLWPGIGVLIRDVTSEATRATDFAIRDSILSTVNMVKSPVMGVLADQIGLRQLFLIGVVGAVIGFTLFLTLFPKPKPEATEKKEEEAEKPSESHKASIVEVLRTLFRGETWRAYVGLLLMGTTWRLFVVGLYPFTSIYLYESIGWTFTFFGVYGALTSIVILVLRIPAGKLVDKHGCRPFIFACMAATSIQWFLMAHVTDMYLIAAVYLATEIIGIGHTLAVGKLWFAAIPGEIFSMGSAVRNTIYGITAASGALLGAYLWSNLGPQLSFYVMSATYLLHTFTAAFIIKEPIDRGC